MDLINSLQDKALAVEGITRDEALSLCVPEVDIHDLMHAANAIREKYFGNKVTFCSIVNAKSGRCANDCAFCSQSVHYNTHVDDTDIIDTESAVSVSRNAAENGAENFGLVTSGVVLSEHDTKRICEIAEKISAEKKIKACTSLGELDEKRARILYDAGIRRYHHNLETSERFYPQICTTYDYNMKIQTLRTAKKIGMKICCGGIFGLGETWEDRVDMAMQIRKLGADSVPINFLRPIEGTPLGNRLTLDPFEALRIIAIYRFILPDRTIKVCGGREHVLRDQQSLMFHAGANGAMLGNYLTTLGRSVEEDLQMLHDLGLELEVKSEVQP